jgi:hypothetical protein
MEVWNMGENRELQELDAVAAERGLILAFRSCDESEDYEPVFLRIENAGVGPVDEVAMVAITDGNGMSLGRYLVPRTKLDAALAEPPNSFVRDYPSADRLV